MKKPGPKREDFSADYLRSLLDYNPETGAFTWKVQRCNSTKAGSIAGCRSGGKRKYWRISIDDSQYPANRLAWLYVTGGWPKLHVDHVDGDPCNNAWLNLRLATNSENMRNRGKTKANTSGYKGVYLNKKSGTWRSAINTGGKCLHLGTYKTPEDAYAAYCLKVRELFGEFHHV